MLWFLTWSILNIFHDFLYKKIHINIVTILFYKFYFIFFISLIYILIYIFLINTNNHKDNILNIQDANFLLKWNSLKSIFSIIGMYCVYKQIIIYSFFSLNLMFYTIPLWELILNVIIKKDPLRVKKNIFLGINNLIILIYFIYNIYYHGVYKYIYGFLSAIMFAISNLLIIKTKEIWYKNNQYIILDILSFSCWMIIFTGIIMKYNNITYNITDNISNSYLHLYLISGFFIQYLLYYFFFKTYETPSVILSNIDLITSFLLDLYINKSYTILEVIIIILIIINKYWQKKYEIAYNK